MKLKNWLLVPIVFLLVTVLAISVTARVRKADLFELDTQKNMSVSVEYDTEPPQVYFIDPDGNEIKDALVADTGSVLYFKLPDAMPGQWKIAYDKGSNEELTVSYAPYFIGAAIEDFSFTQTENKIINVKFNVNSELDQYYNFAIYAVAMNGDAVDGQLLLKNGSAILGREEDFDIRLSDLETYDHYHLMLEIWYDQDGTELFDTAIAEGEFSYVNEDTPAALENVKVNVDSDDGITVDWSEYSKYCEKYLLSIFEGNATEPVFYQEYDSSVTSSAMILDPSIEKIRVELRYRTWNELSAPVFKMVDRTLLSHVSIESDAANGSQARVSYDMQDLGISMATVTVNGETDQIRLEGKDFFSVGLDWFDNEVSVTWTLPTDEAVSYTVTAKTYNDRTAPSLTLYEITGTAPLRTNKSQYILVGSTDQGCTVSVDNKVIETDENGTFRVTLDLKDGTNTFSVTAQNTSGIKSEQTVVIVKNSVISVVDEPKEESLLSYIPLAGSFLFATALTLFVLISGKAYVKRKEKFGKKVALLSALKAVLIFLAVLAAIAAGILIFFAIRASEKIEGASFLEIVSHSVSQAYEMILASDALIKWSITCGIISVVAIILSILIGLLIKRIKNGPKPKKEKKPSKKKSAKPNFCTNCGAKNEGNQKFCSNCGNPLQ